MNVSDQALVKAFQQADKVLSAPKARAFGAGDIAAACAVYCKLRPIIIKILPKIEKIPIFGETLAKILKVLMAIANVACTCSVK